MRGSTRKRATWLGVATAGTLVLLSGCTGGLDSFNIVTSRGQSVSNLFLLTIIIAAIIVLGIAIVLAYILIRYRDRPGAPAPRPNRHVNQFQATWIIAMIVLFAVFAGLMFHSMNIIGAPASASALHVNVIGHQWWWEYQYPDLHITTANELHLPAGRSVVLKFAFPDTAGRSCTLDLMDREVSGTSELRLTAADPGIRRAQWSEQGTCPAMGLLIVVQPNDAFEAWRAEQARPAQLPRNAAAARGQEIFLSRTCAMCHAVRGTPAGSRVGPDLTHVARRHQIAGGVRPRARETMAAWITAPAHLKPRTEMPPTQLRGDELDALMIYLEGLR